MSRVSSSLIAVCVWSAPLLARAEEPRPGSTYTVRAGDTCVSVAVRAYGDRRRIDLLHKGNPQLGATPHRLQAGQQLNLPAATEPAASSPDAKLRAVRNVVLVEAEQAKPGKVNDPLYRGNRVSTEKRSGADVLFRDESELRLGETTLVVILGDSKARARSGVAETTLVSGELTAKLSALSKGQTVQTAGADTTLGKGESRVSVDGKNATRLAVLSGTAGSIKAEKKTVKVQPGYGSKAELGKPPTPPRPLPPAPVWEQRWPSLAMTPEGRTAKVGGKLVLTQTKLSGVRVQIAQDAQFNDLVSDVFVPTTTTGVEAEGLTGGAYYVRVAGVDDDEFVGAFGEVLVAQVVSYREVPHADGSVRLVPSDPRVICGEPSDEGKIACRLDGASSNAEVEVLVAKPEPAATPPAEVQPEPPPAPAPEQAHPERGFELQLAAMGALGWKSTSPGAGARLGVSYALPLGPGAFTFGLAAQFEAFPRNRRSGLQDGDQKLPLSYTSQWDASLGLPLGYRFGGRHATLHPTLQLQPELVWQRTRYDVLQQSQSQLLFGLRATVGARVVLSPTWQLGIEGGFRFTPRAGEPSAPLRGPVLMLGLNRLF